MKIHHLNCATLCPRGMGWISDEKHMVCHCLLIEARDGLVLVDTGLGLKDLSNPKSRLGRLFNFFARPALSEQETAVRQIEKLGFSPQDVQHIVLTHLDLDHAGALSDFPKASVHVFDAEYEAACKGGFWGKMRYRPTQWSHQVRWVSYNVSGEPWFGFKCVRELKGLPPEILMVPLLGHSKGHSGIAVKTDEDKWILHAGDAYFDRKEVDTHDPECPTLLGMFQWFIQYDGALRKENQNRLREVKNKYRDKIQVFCSHDPIEFKWWR